MFLYWIDKQRFGGSSQPHLSDLPFLQNLELNGIICLQEKRNSEELAQLLDVPFFHKPIPDFGIPTTEDIRQIIEFIDEQKEINPEKPVLIHCTAGNGRTGTILASLLKLYDKVESEEAIKQIRKINPLAIETEEQEQFIRDL
jgi:atypical dual specificity phosphatase